MRERISLPILYCALVLTLGLSLTGCQRAESPEGIVATVNGSPIHLTTLQALQDSRTVSLGTSQRPSVESFKKQYGAALSVLIINTLVMQELDKLGLSVSDAAVQAVEDQVRADYTEKNFEKMLTEEYIDLQQWRQLTRQQLSISAFQDKVLRPQVHVSLEEVQAYYAKNKAEFVLPDSLTLVQVSGNNKEQVAEARAAAPDFAKQMLTDVTVQRFTIRRQSVPQEWQKDVQGLSVGKSTAVKNRDGFFQFVTLVAVHPTKVVPLSDAYALVNDILLEDKLQDRFVEWVERAVQKAHIKVAAQLHAEIGIAPVPKPAKNSAPENSAPAPEPANSSAPASPSPENSGQDNEAPQDTPPPSPAATVHETQEVQEPPAGGIPATGPRPPAP